jgi:hypothetical protein
MNPEPPRLGELLLEGGKITAQQLERALRTQAQRGARIGTNLVELDLVSILDLGATLAGQRGVPEAHPEDFMNASPRLLGIFPRELAAKHRVFPLSVHDKVLHLAMIDPQNTDQIHDVGFVTGLHVTPLVAPELRMVFFLEQRFGLARPARFASTGQSGEGSPARGGGTPKGRGAPKGTGPAFPSVRDVPLRADPTGPAHPAVSAPPRRVETGPAHQMLPPLVAPADEEDPELVFLDDVPHGAPDDDFEVTVDLEGEPTTGAGPAEQPEGLAAVRIALSKARDRNTVAALAVRPVLSCPSLYAVFRIHKEVAMALAAAPSSVPAAEVRRLELPLSPGSLLQRAEKSAELTRGAASADPLQKVLSAYLRAPEPDQVLVAPVVVSRRVVSLICVQLPAGTTVDEAEVGNLRELASAVAGAYVRLIREAKGR